MSIPSRVSRFLPFIALTITSLAAAPPTLRYSTYLGGSGFEEFPRVARDAQGNIIIAATSNSTSLALPGGVNTTYGGGFSDALICKISPQGQLLWWTFFGGNGQEDINAIAVAPNGNIFIGGATQSTDLPRTGGSGTGGFVAGFDSAGKFRFAYAGAGISVVNGIDATSDGTIWATGATGFFIGGASPTAIQGSPGGQRDAFAVQFDSVGALLHFTYLGGAADDYGHDIKVSPAGNIIVTGFGFSANFPGVAAGTINLSSRAAFVTSLDIRAKEIRYSTPITYSAGNPVALAADANGVWMGGTTAETGFVSTANAFQPKPGGRLDNFLVRLNNTGAVTYATFLGGTQPDSMYTMRTDSTGNVYVTGIAGAADFPTTPDATRRTTGAGFLSIFKPSGELLYSTFTADQPGELIWALDVSASGQLITVSQTGLTSLPIAGTPIQRTLAGNSDVYISVYDSSPVVSSPRPALTASAVLNAASFAGGAVAPGEVVTLFPSNAGPAQIVTAQLTPQRTISTVLADTRVLFDGVAAPMIYSLQGQISAVVPYGVQNRAATSVVVEYKGVASLPVSVPVAAAAPALFTTGNGSGQLVAIPEEGCCNSTSLPAKRGKIVVLYATGEGQTSPEGRDGTLAEYDSLDKFPKPALAAEILIDGMSAEILYAGAAPGFVAGLMQINVRVPANASVGDAVPVVLKVGSFTSPQKVTLIVR